MRETHNEKEFNPSFLDRVKFLFSGNKNTLLRQQQYGTFGFGFTNPDYKISNYIKDGYTKNATLYSIVRLISRQASLATWGTYKIVDENEFKRYKALSLQTLTHNTLFAIKEARHKALKPIGNTYLDELLKYPNKEQGGQEFTEQVIASRLITGNSFEFALRSDIGRLKGKPLSLYSLPPDKMTIIAGGGFPVTVEGFELHDAQIVKFDKEEILHTKYWNPNFSLLGNHLYGLSPVSAAYANILSDNESKLASIEQLQNRGLRKVLGWDFPTSVTPSDIKTFSETQNGKFQERWQQLKLENKGDVAMIAGKLSGVDVGLSLKDLQILEIGNFTKDDLCNIYNISSILLNNHSSSTESNVVEMRKDFIQKAVIPELNQERDARNRKLQSDWGYKGENIYLDYDSSVFTELQEDKKALAEWLSTAWWISPNRKNFWMDEPISDDPNMDNIYIPNNLTTLEKANLNFDNTNLTNNDIQNQNGGVTI